MTKDKHLRFFGVNARDTVQAAVDLHYLSITCSVALGRLLIGGLLMAADMKNEMDLLTLRVDGDGAIGTLLVTAGLRLNPPYPPLQRGELVVKGYVQNPQVELPMNVKGFSISLAIGSGSLSVIKGLTNSPPYIGQIELISGEIGEDLCYYYRQSEQIDTVINLGILIDSDAHIRQAGGIMVQCLPETPKDIIAKLNENVSKFPNLSDFMDMGHSIEDILEKYIFKGIPIDIFEQKPVSYYCDCHKSRFYDGIKMLGKEEIQEIINEKEEIVAECHFCNKKYSFSKEELESMIYLTGEINE